METIFSSTYIYYEISIIICIFLSAFFSGTEIAIVSSNKIKLQNLNKKGNKRAKWAIYILDNMEDAMGMILIGNNVVNIVAATFIAYVATNAVHLNSQAMTIVTVIQTIIFLIACELTPKVVARAKTEQYLMTFSLLIKVLMILLKPLNSVALYVARTLKNMLNIAGVGNSLIMSRDEIDILFGLGQQDGVIEGEHKEFVSEILTIREITAFEVMTPTIDLQSIDIEAGIREIVDIIAKTRFSKVPVYRDRVDNIVGYIFFRDLLLNKDRVQNVADVIRKASYIPITKNIGELYIEMQREDLPVVFVVNEYGGVVGMISHEDIAEEIVGEIHTRDHDNEELISQVEDNIFIIDGNLDIEFFQKNFPLKIEKKGFETIAGFLYYQMGKIPQKGESYIYNKMTFVIEEATDRSVEKIQVITPTRKKKKK